MSPSRIREILGSSILEAGFLSWGAAAAGPIAEDHARLLSWIRSGRHGDLSYMEARAPVLADPACPSFLDGARTIVVASIGFDRPAPPGDSLASAVARHARGRDYHDVVSDRLRPILKRLRREVPGLRGRLFVDTAPIMEKAWARRAGLGWIGRNGLLVQRSFGTRTVLGGLAITAEVDPDAPCEDGCGECRECVEACPLRAIGEDRLVDARLCLAAITGAGAPDRALAPAEAASLAGRISYGCDLCQDACPHNRKAPAGDPAFDPLPALADTSVDGFMAMDRDRAAAILRGTAMEAVGVDRLRASLTAARPWPRARS